MERDPLKSCNVATILISTHTLTWSVTYSGFATGTNYQISTHTLTWSVTYSDVFKQSFNKISTHTLTWSVTTTTETIEQDTGDFNSHAHVERDFSTSIVPSSYSISTHTLTWSVTSKLNAVVVHDIFQLTRSRGA